MYIGKQLNSILSIQHSPKSQICLRGLYNPHIGSIAPKKEEKKLSQGKRGKTFRRATEEDPSPGWTEARDVQNEQRYRVTTHSMNMTEMYEL